ncbi:MAG: hypothetical protein QM820_41350 [Minicystis sp.]
MAATAAWSAPRWASCSAGGYDSPESAPVATAPSSASGSAAAASLSWMLASVSSTIAFDSRASPTSPGAIPRPSWVKAR